MRQKTYTMLKVIYNSHIKQTGTYCLSIDAISENIIDEKSASLA